MPGGGGVVIADYECGDLKVFSPQGEQVQALFRPFAGWKDATRLPEHSGGLWTPSAIAFVGNGTAWVLESDRNQVVLLRLAKWKFRRIKVFRRPRPGVEIVDLAVADDELLVLCLDHGSGENIIKVLDKASGEFRREFGNESVGAECMAAYGAHVYLADPYNHVVKMFTHADGVLRKIIGRQGSPDDESDDECDDKSDERGSTRLGEFNEPYGIAVGNGQIIVSENAGQRIQVLSLEGEPLQVIPLTKDDAAENAMTGRVQIAGGLCLEEKRLWCLGPLWNPNHVDVFVRI